MTPLEALPPHLAERARLRGAPGPAPRWVLYWMRTAVRDHENPALDVAASIARALDVPVFVYHALSERYPYASDRHHRFVLEGAAEVGPALRARGFGYAFHLERPGHRGPHLKTLAEDAGLVVTEDMPVPPLDDWTTALAEVAPVVLVDTACVVPMKLTERPERAFRHREATAELREARLAKPWQDVPSPGAFVPELPFAPVELEDARLDALIASCAIDHGVARVPHTKGGASAGYARWSRFLDGPIDRYEWDRNDPLKDGVSRMSAYLHMGFLSPFRVAREAAARGGEGATKFLDELLVWRELAYAFCFHQPRLHDLEVLPAWARATLAEHAHDARRELAYETLARARTGDPLWDTAQRSLLRQGELHNNVRMTWGKAVLGWTRDAREALDVLIDLNHRYALDGRDPASYGGILWCLGLFDRPFDPPAPVRGRLRARPTRAHAKRLDVAAWSARVSRPPKDLRVAVIGAGVAGLACARTLHDHGVEVTVFDKGRRVGGRLNTRRHKHDDEALAFDHGAQFVSAKDPRFVRPMKAWLEAGVMARWSFRERAGGDERSTTRLVGAGSMRRLAEHLAEDLDVRLETRIAPWAPGARQTLETVEGEAIGEYDAVVVTAPLVQARELLSAHEVPGLERGAHAPCWATMLAFASRLPTELDAVRDVGVVGWAARDSSKPGRAAGERWTVHASVAASEAMLEQDAQTVAATMTEALGDALGIALPPPVFARAHRWRYARVVEPIGEDCLCDAERRVIVAGDAMLGPKVEAAYLSGVAAAGRLLG